jgi:hypothetical protein
MAPKRNSALHQAQVVHGDWQTPPGVARRVTALLRARGVEAAAVVEPTCGRGAFVEAALSAFPGARVLGFEVSAAHLASARDHLRGTRAELHHADFFAVDWEVTLGALPDPVLILGNPPWVTSATLGAHDAQNLPDKSNFKGHRGLDAITGKANFDISEWMMLRLLEALRGRPFTLAMLCKSSVARRLLAAAAARGWPVDGATWSIDAKAHFDAAVDAVLLTISSRSDAPAAHRWPMYDGLDAVQLTRAMGVAGGEVVSDLDAFDETRALAGRSEIEWRSGVKHDCAAVMELRRAGDALVNGLGERVELEPDFVFPMCKGSDVANGRTATGRYVIVTQRAIGDDTARIQAAAPRTWSYLAAHRSLLEGRKSSIYRGQPSFAMFGVGDYSFAPHKVAICGLYKRLRFVAIGPEGGRPVMLDDTAYFLPCETLARAEALVAALNGPQARRFFEARVFWDAKRPVSKALLQTLSLAALLREAHGPAICASILDEVPPTLAGIG